MQRFDDDLVLATPRLVLRALRDDDAAALHAVFADPRVMRYGSTPPWTSTGQAEGFIERSRAAMASGDALRLGLERRDDAQLIGQCTLFDFAFPSARAEIGYSMRADAWGRGLMHEALTALIDHGFGTLRLHRIEADIDPRNTPSARSLERLGFVREGLLRERWRVDGEVSDSALYGLLAREWAVRRAATPG
ncbi:MAG TPA: GNAT family N-acetyltransferase [Burkholderiaceae bacterium]|nr:GNAT family N-acetyltransferase [Burkholderiaceae bacterium]